MAGDNTTLSHDSVKKALSFFNGKVHNELFFDDFRCIRKNSHLPCSSHSFDDYLGKGRASLWRKKIQV
jgi:hypothetical protein